ncbi:MAG TPA: bifunctional nicotinamidase/pyrazinamidase [Bacteroidales bacterium]|nr:bifunctional nicotinamidase/pyrazinamidase [Bacteroidales bacterium]
MKTLLIVDVQNDFLLGGALAVPFGDEVIEVINKLMPKFELVVATQDWHPANHGSFASAHLGMKPFDVGRLGSVEQVMWPDHCVQGTSGAELSSKLNSNAIEAIFRKGTDAMIDSYSAFYDNARMKSTGLGSYLKGRNVSELFIVGLAADYCVGFSALDALELGFRTMVVDDATKPISEKDFIAMRQKIHNQGGAFLISSEIL